MNEWLSRALVSAAASVVSTGVLVATAERRGKRRKKKTGAKKKTKSTKPKEPLSPIARAERELKRLPDAGMTVDDLVSSWKAKGASAKAFLFGEREEGVPRAPDEVKPAVKVEREQPKKPKKDGYAQMKEELFHVATSAVKEKVVESTGMSGALDVVKGGAEKMKSVGQELGRRVQDAIPDDLGAKVGDAGKKVVAGGRKLGDAIASAIPDEDVDLGEIKDKVDDGFAGFTRWVEGPGAPNYRDPRAVDDGQDGDAVTPREGKPPSRPIFRALDDEDGMPAPRADSDENGSKR